jgi:hypothetical protein
MQLDPRVFAGGGGVDLASRHYGLKCQFLVLYLLSPVLDADQTVDGPLWKAVGVKEGGTFQLLCRSPSR